MGLDMYLFTARRELITAPVDFGGTVVDYSDLHYWRKHHNLHGWMQRLYASKGGVDIDFNLSPLAFEMEDLAALKAPSATMSCRKCATSFTAARIALEWRNDLAAIEKARAVINQGLGVFYAAWW